MPARDITRVLLFFLALSSCAFAARARAASELDLQWPAIAGCPRRAQTIARVEDQLGRKLGEVDDALRAEVRITRSALGFTLTLETAHGGTRGQRTFQAARCDEAQEAAVLVIALALGQAEAARAAEQERAPEAPAAEPTPPPAERTERATPPRRSRSIFSMRAGATVEGGFLPGAGIGSEVALSFHVARSHIEAAGLWLAPKSSDPRFDGSAVEVTLYTGRLSYCHDLVAVRRNQLGACGGVEVGQASGKGVALETTFVRNFLWSAGWLSLRLTSQLLPHFGLVLEPAVGIPFAQHRFVSTTPQQDRTAVLHTPRPTSKRITLGAAFFF
ncbi:MAG: hypothetical protein ABW252_09700 [Polyangiales bacterium]